MSDLSLNSNLSKQEVKVEPVETGGVIASNTTNTPSPLFNSLPSVETSGSIASSGGSTSYVC